MPMRPRPRVSILRNSFTYSSRAGDAVEPVVGPTLDWQAASIAHKARVPLLARLALGDLAWDMAAIMLASGRCSSSSGILATEEHCIPIRKGPPGQMFGRHARGLSARVRFLSAHGCAGGRAQWPRTRSGAYCADSRV